MRFWNFELPVGTRVRCIEKYIGVPVGEEGTVVHAELSRLPGSQSQLLCVNWDRERGGLHSCGGKAVPGHGWNVRVGYVKITGFETWKGVEKEE